MPVCPKCGHKNPADRIRCEECLARLTATPGSQASPTADSPLGKETQSEVAKGASASPMWFAVIFGVIIGTGGVRLFLDLGFWPTVLLNAAIIGLLAPVAMIIQWLLNRLQGRG